MNDEAKKIFGSKLKRIRQTHNLTQNEISEMVGISRVNWNALENGKNNPTQLFINCVALMFEVDKGYLTNATQTDANVISSSAVMLKTILDKYDLLNDEFKRFIDNQIVELLEIQKRNE